MANEPTNEEKAKGNQIGVIVEDPKTVNMTVEDMMKAERDIQLGLRDTLIDGRKIKDVQEENEAIQADQEKQRSILIEKDVVEPEKQPSKFHSVAGVPTEVPTKADEKKAEMVANNEIPPTGDTDIPKNFPNREKLIGAGIVSYDSVKAMIYDDYMAAGFSDEESRAAVQWSMDHS